MTDEIPTTTTLDGVKWAFYTCPDCCGEGIKRRITEVQFRATPHQIMGVARTICGNCAGHGMVRKMFAKENPCVAP